MLKLKLHVTALSGKKTGQAGKISAYFESRYGHGSLSVISELDDPVQALSDEVLITPTLIKTEPEPRRRIFGDISNPPELASHLGLGYAAASGV